MQTLHRRFTSASGTKARPGFARSTKASAALRALVAPREVLRALEPAAEEAKLHECEWLDTVKDAFRKNRCRSVESDRRAFMWCWIDGLVDKVAGNTMRRLIIKILRNSRRTRQTIKYLLQFKNRPPKYYFLSPYAARSPKLEQANGTPNANRLQDIEHGRIGGLSLHRDVISFPLDGGRVKSHKGGITDGTTYTLVPEAIHFNSELCQEPPENDTSKLNVDQLPVIKHVVLYGGIMYNNFGHFLLESLARLWSYRLVKELDPYILFYTYWGDPNYFEKRNYVHQVLVGFGIPLKRIVFLNQIARIEQLIVPAQKYGYEICRNPDQLFMEFIRGFAFPVEIPRTYKDADHIYVSRARLSSNLGRLIGEADFEIFLKSCGYRMFYPEDHTIHEQLTVYSRARRIIFADGGALHACILLPDLKAEVSIISRRRDPVWTPSDIADQFRGYGKPVLWVDAVKDQYQFGLDTWNAISTIDWFAVSEILKEHGFVHRVFSEFHQIDYDSQIKQNLRNYISQVVTNPRFINYMMELNEPDAESAQDAMTQGVAL